MISNEKKDVIKLLITIVNRGKGNVISEILSSHFHFLNYLTLGKGTATSEILDYLGLGETDKDVIISLIPESSTKKVMKQICEASGTKKPGNGIAFTVPLSGISSTTLSIAKIENEETLLEENKMETSDKNDLIIAVVNSNNYDKVMDAARSAGATGGTVLHAKSLSADEIEKFFGIFLQPEKEIIAIIVKREIKQDVMKNIIKEAGINTECKGIVFSLPAENITFLGK